LTKLPPALAACVLRPPRDGGGPAGANLARTRARRALANLSPTAASC
jgi:hypothetical protein